MGTIKEAATEFPSSGSPSRGYPGSLRGTEPTSCISASGTAGNGRLPVYRVLLPGVIDGAPAARFATTFRQLLESASVLAPPGGALEVASPAPTIGL
jgi:hypothetical protein